MLRGRNMPERLETHDVKGNSCMGRGLDMNYPTVPYRLKERLKLCGGNAVTSRADVYNSLVLCTHATHIVVRTGFESEGIVQKQPGYRSPYFQYVDVHNSI